MHDLSDNPLFKEMKEKIDKKIASMDSSIIGYKTIVGATNMALSHCARRINILESNAIPTYLSKKTVTDVIQETENTIHAILNVYVSEDFGV